MVVTGRSGERGERRVLRTRAVEVSLWEAVLPPEVLRLPEELARVDVLLDDPVFFAPFVPFFDARVGRRARTPQSALRTERRSLVMPLPVIPPTSPPCPPQQVHSRLRRSYVYCGKRPRPRHNDRRLTWPSARSPS
jgi:hypothetical protein